MGVRAMQAGWPAAFRAPYLQLQLLETSEMSDALSGLAFLRALPGNALNHIDQDRRPRRGNSLLWSTTLFQSPKARSSGKQRLITVQRWSLGDWLDRRCSTGSVRHLPE